MGMHEKVGAHRFPLQSTDNGKRVMVRFWDDKENDYQGTLVRSDRGEPWLAIIKLDDGRYVTDNECMYSVI